MRLEILIGMIASGKSTYSKHRAKAGAIIVNDDAIVLAVHGGDYTLYNGKYKPIYKATETQIAMSALSLGFDVVIDRGVNITESARRRWIGLARAFDYPTDAVVFPCEDPMIHAGRRFAHDSRGISLNEWIKIAKKHLDRWEHPTYDEGFDDIRHISHPFKVCVA